jgi:hypothetical protein
VVDHEISELVVLSLVIRVRNHPSGVGVQHAAVVRAQHVNVVGGDVVVAEQRRIGTERRDPLTTVERQPRLHGGLRERRAVVGGAGDVDRCEVQARDIEVVVPGRVLGARDRDVDVTARRTHTADRVGLAPKLQSATGSTRAADRSQPPPQHTAASDPELGTEKGIVHARDVNCRLASRVGATPLAPTVVDCICP